MRDALNDGTHLVRAILAGDADDAAHDLWTPQIVPRELGSRGIVI